LEASGWADHHHRRRPSIRCQRSARRWPSQGPLRPLAAWAAVRIDSFGRKPSATFMPDLMNVDITDPDMNQDTSRTTGCAAKVRG
jgi:hypothetical protein